MCYVFLPSFLLSLPEPFFRPVKRAHWGFTSNNLIRTGTRYEVPCTWYRLRYVTTLTAVPVPAILCVIRKVLVRLQTPMPYPIGVHTVPVRLHIL